MLELLSMADDPPRISGYNGSEEEPTMPLRDHFRPPLDNMRHWEGFHGHWPAMMVLALSRKIPPRYVAAPCDSCDPDIEIDTTREADDPPTWVPPQPAISLV